MTKLRQIGEILKEERQRLGMSQADFAAVAGLTGRAQIRYEQTEPPGGNYFRALSEIGVDIQYVLTGLRTISVVTDEEQKLLSVYRSLDYRGKGGVWGTMNGILSARPDDINMFDSDERMVNKYQSDKFKTDDEPLEIQELKERYRQASPTEKEVIMKLARQVSGSSPVKRKITGGEKK